MKTKLMLMVAAVAVAFGAWAATEKVGDYTWTYRINGDTAEITEGISPSPTGAVTIPSTLGGKPVTSIDYGAFRGCSGLTSVTIPDSVTSIGGGAFSGCSGLTSVMIPDSVTSIEWDAFGGTAFYNNQPDGLVVFGKVAYKMKGTCPASVTIPDGVTSIGSYAFRDCDGLTSVMIPDSVTSIGWDAFSGCSSLTSMTIPDGVTTIEERAFLDCSGLTSVTIPDSVTSIEYKAFSGCSGLTSVTISDSVTSIGVCAFSGCSGLTSVTIPDSVTSIDYGAFRGCSGLTSVTIPDSVTSIGEGAFDETAFYNNQPDGLVVFGKVAYKMKGTCPASVTIPYGVMSIGEGAFEECDGLTSVTIPDSVTTIGYDAFYCCSSLTSVEIPDSVTFIPWDAFDGCPRLWASWFRVLGNLSGTGGGGSSGGGGTGGGAVIATNDCRYALTDHVADRTIASVMVDDDCAIDEFVLKDGKVYDCVLRIVNTAEREITLTLPAGYEYEAFKGAKPLRIPANSRNILTITRTADTTFLVSREELETVQ